MEDKTMKSLVAEAKLWRSAAKSLAEELESVINIINETACKDNPLPMAPAVDLYKFTVAAVDAANSQDIEGLAHALRDARRLVQGL